MARLLAVSLLPVTLAVASHAAACTGEASSTQADANSTAAVDLARAVEPRCAPERPSAGDWGGIRAAHEAWRRRIVATAEGHAARAHVPAWRTTFDGRGFTVEPEEGSWSWGLELERWGFQPALREVRGLAAGCAEGERLEYARDASLTEWYVNGAGGLEHGYTVHRRPAGEGALVFELAVRGGLLPEVDADGRGARMVDGSGASALVYAGLAAFDATGRELDARLASRAGKLCIEVVERGARYPLWIDPTVQEAYLKPWNTGVGDHFGSSIAVSGSTVVVGAPHEDSASTTIDLGQADDSASEAGAAYVFVRSGTGWVQQAYLKASNCGAGDEFGGSVSVSGDTVVVGAGYEDSNSTAIDTGQADNSANGAGAAYVFVRNGTAWSQQAYLKASNCQANDYFGFAVAVSGETVVVGSLLEDSSSNAIDMGQADNNAQDAGAAYVFVRNGTTWSQQSYLKASNAQDFDWFGYAVAVSGDTALVGASAEDSSSTTIDMGQADNSYRDAGAVYVFVRGGTGWSQQAYLKASNAGGADLFGTAVSLSDSTAVVGAPQEDSTSSEIDMGQGNNIATSAGAAYVFERSGTSWSQQAYLKASNTDGFDQFGFSVSVSGDTVVVGASEEDSASHVIDMGQADDSAPSAGAAYTFVRSGTTWGHQSYLKASNAQAGDRFGLKVAVSGPLTLVAAVNEGSGSTTIDVGQSDESAPVSGAAYAFRAVLASVPVCIGDGSGAACPCGNQSAPGAMEGCLNSLGLGGRLRGSGSTSLAVDTLRLTGSQMPSAPALHFQGTLTLGGGAGAPFGDGLRCAGGALVRLKQVVNVGGMSQYPAAGDPPVSVRGLVTAPGSRTYQVWYRNAAPFCSPDGWNLTNGVEVTWAP